MKSVSCVILAGGQATRMRELCKGYPKTLLEVGAEPILLNQVKNLKRAGAEKITISTNNADNKHLIEKMLNENNLKDVTVISNCFHKKGSLWGLLGALKNINARSTIFCFSDIFYPNQIKDIRAYRAPWLSGFTTDNKTDIMGGGVAEISSDNTAKKLYYKNVPQELTKALVWSGLTHLTEKEVGLLEEFLESSSDDIPEEDFINHCIKKGSKFRIADDGYFVNVNSPSDLAKARSAHDKNNI